MIRFKNVSFFKGHFEEAGRPLVSESYAIFDKIDILLPLLFGHMTPFLAHFVTLRTLRSITLFLIYMHEWLCVIVVCFSFAHYQE